MLVEHWGYGLGCISGAELEQLYYEAEGRAGSWKVSEEVAVSWLIAREQLRRLGMIGMAEGWSDSMNSPSFGEREYPVVRGLLDAEFRQRAWVDLRKGLAQGGQLPTPYLDQSTFFWRGGDVESAVRRLEELDFIESATSVAFVGESLTLKSYYAHAIGVEAMVRRNKRVKAVNTSDFVAMLESATTSGARQRRASQMLKYDLVILDKFADVPFNVDGALLLAQLLGKLAGFTSVMVTTRLAASEWPSAFGNSEKCAEHLRLFAEGCRVVDTGVALRRADFEPQSHTFNAAPMGTLADDVPF